MILESSFAIQHACKVAGQSLVGSQARVQLCASELPVSSANLAAYNLLKDKAVYSGERAHEIHASNRAVMLTSSNPLFLSCH